MNQPLVVEVNGLPGAGSTTLARALTKCFGVVALTDAPAGDAPPDLLVRVVGAQVRSADTAAIAMTEAPILVVASKCDTRRADQRPSAPGRQVYPVSGLLAGLTVTQEDVELLSEWQGGGLVVPVVAAAFAEHPEQARLLAAYGRWGLARAMTAVAEQPGIDAQALTAHLRAASGIDALAPPIRALSGQIAARRRAHRLSGLRLLAARGFDRTAAEYRLAAESLR